MALIVPEDETGQNLSLFLHDRGRALNQNEAILWYNILWFQDQSSRALKIPYASGTVDQYNGSGGKGVRK